MKADMTLNPLDLLRQGFILIASPLIWVFSSLGFFIETARSPSAFSDLTLNFLVPQTTAFSIWLPIFIGILAYGIIQARPNNRARKLYQQSGWWMVAGLWGIAVWGLVTAFTPDDLVELIASAVFIPTMICLVIAMVKIWRRRDVLNSVEKWLVLTPISVLAGWCSIAVFIGLNGLIWSHTEAMGWNITATAISVLGIALWWIIYILRQRAMNKIYAFPIIWGLGFLALRHLGDTGNIWIGGGAVIGVFSVVLASTIKPRQSTG